MKYKKAYNKPISKAKKANAVQPSDALAPGNWIRPLKSQNIAKMSSITTKIKEKTKIPAKTVKKIA